MSAGPRRPEMLSAAADVVCRRGQIKEAGKKKGGKIGEKESPMKIASAEFHLRDYSLCSFQPDVSRGTMPSHPLDGRCAYHKESTC